jgi:hypothetical protein
LFAGCHGQSDDLAALGLAFDTPFDFNDDSYRKHGIDPDKLINRLTPSHDFAAAGKSQDTSRNGTRILQAFGGYGSRETPPRGLESVPAGAAIGVRPSPRRPGIDAASPALCRETSSLVAVPGIRAGCQLIAGVGREST